MTDPLVIDVSLHWAAVVVYAAATLANAYGLIFKREGAEKAGYLTAVLGLLVHGAAIIYRWSYSGHGPYMARYEVFSSDAWVAMFAFLVFARFFPKIRPASVFVFPFVFLLIAIGLFLSPEVRKLPPSLKSIWLVLHVTFYKIALGTILIAMAFSIFYILKKRTEIRWLSRLPELDTLDIYAYRFAGFGFTFWAIAMLTGSIWAYQSWGRFWGWDPIETWSLITWVSFGIYLHLRRFFMWKGERSAVLFMVCVIMSIIAVFFVPLIESSIHAGYFK